jgi:hypothetical protein
MRRSEMSESTDGKKPGWWSRVQQVMVALVTLSGEAAKVADAVRRILR